MTAETNIALMLTFEVKLNKNGRKALCNVLHYFTIANGKVVKWRGTEDTAATKQLWND